jgi:heavy metal sensor kinase
VKRLNVRWRLTLWYGCVLTAIVVGLGACVYLMMQRDLLERTDFELDEELTELVLEVRLAKNDQDLQEQLQRRFYRHASFDFQVSTIGGQALFRSERLAGTSLRPPDARRLDDAEVGVFQTGRVERLGVSRVASRIAQGQRGALIVQASMPLAENRQELHALLVTFLAVGPVAIAASLAGGYFLARRALAPVDRMATTAALITASRLSDRIEITNADDELGHLGQTLNAMMDRLQRAVEELQRFTADAAHELRTPLAVLQTEAEVALRMPRTADEYRHVVEVALDESRRLTRLADRLLQLSRHDSGLHPFRREEVPLDALLKDVTDQIRTSAAEKGVALEVGPLGEWIVVGDDIQLSQLLFNLLDNAIKFTPPGGRVSIGGEQRDGGIFLQVSDTGTGIPTADLPHVFDRFYRADKSRNGNTGGTGLGLAICQAIVIAHGGRIGLESRSGAGTTVHVSLPASPSAET